MESRRNSLGQVLGPKLFDDRSYDERQIEPARDVALPDSLDLRVRFLNRWCRGWEQKPAIEQELRELIRFGKGKP